MDDPFGMQILQSKDYLGYIELRALFIKGANLLQKSREVTPLHELHDHIEELF